MSPTGAKTHTSPEHWLWSPAPLPGVEPQLCPLQAMGKGLDLSEPLFPRLNLGMLTSASQCGVDVSGGALRGWDCEPSSI